MELQPILFDQLVELTVNDPWIASFVLEDDQVYAHNSSVVALGVFDEHNQYQGCFLLVNKFKRVMEIHTCLMKDFTEKKRAAYLVYEWLIKNTETNTLTTMVPSIYKHVRRFCLSVGMVDGGEIPAAFLKNGKLESVKVYSITRMEMENALCQQRQL